MISSTGDSQLKHLKFKFKKNDDRLCITKQVMDVKGKMVDYDFAFDGSMHKKNKAANVRSTKPTWLDKQIVKIISLLKKLTSVTGNIKCNAKYIPFEFPVELPFEDQFITTINSITPDYKQLTSMDENYDCPPISDGIDVHMVDNDGKITIEHFGGISNTNDNS